MSLHPITSGYSGMVGRPDTASMVEAKYPALRFKQQLTAYVEKIYGDNEREPEEGNKSILDYVHTGTATMPFQL